MSPHISTQSDKINEGYCAIGGVHIRRFNAEQVAAGLPRVIYSFICEARSASVYSVVQYYLHKEKTMKSE